MRQLYHTLLVICILPIGNYTQAQQTPVFSDYYYNQTLINPAYSGVYSKTEISISNFGYLNQFEGSPKTFSGVFNTPISKYNVGLGGGFISDQIGVTSINTIFVSYAYKLYFRNKNAQGRWWNEDANVLSFGLTTGISFFNENLSELEIQGDPDFENDVNVTIPSFGFGILYNRNKFYLGFSAQNLFSGSFSSEKNINIKTPYYIYGGYKWYFNNLEEIQFQPSILAKFVSGAPTQFDFNFSANYKNKIEIGAGYRTSSSFNALIGFYFLENWRFAYSYTAIIKNSPLNNTSGLILTYRTGEGF